MRRIALIFFSLIWLFGCTVTSQNTSNSQNGSCQSESNQLAISQVQGAGHLSPFNGEEVFCLKGVVTAKDGGGFYMQSETPDEDSATSEGIYVLLLSFALVEVGDEVLISSGEIKEYNPAGVGENSLTRTSIRTSDLEVLSSGNDLPAPVLIGEGGRAIPDRIIENDVNGYVGQGEGLFDPDEDGKFEEAKSLANELKTNYVFKAGDYKNNIQNLMGLYDEICLELSKIY